MRFILIYRQLPDQHNGKYKYYYLIVFTKLKSKLNYSSTLLLHVGVILSWYYATELFFFFTKNVNILDLFFLNCI